MGRIRAGALSPLAFVLLFALPGCRFGANSAAKSAAEAPSLAQCLGGSNWREFICGPFSVTAVSKCQDLDGGEMCLTQKWNRDMHKRVAEALPEAAAHCLEAGEGSNTDKCGPFEESLVKECLESGGGDACVGNRWSLTLHTRLTAGKESSEKREKSSQQSLASVSKFKVNHAYRVVLRAPHLHQYDNGTAKDWSSSTTALAMVLQFQGAMVKPDELGAPVYRTEDLVAKANRAGMRAEVFAAATAEQMKGRLREGQPVILETRMVTGGHFVTLIGFDDEAKEWIVNDPAGEWDGREKGDFVERSRAAGHEVRYSYSSLEKVPGKAYHTLLVHR